VPPLSPGEARVALHRVEAEVALPGGGQGRVAGWRPSRAPPSPGEAQVALRWVEAESCRRVEAESRAAVCGRVTHRLVEDEVAGHRVEDKQVASHRFAAP
jgi:hypothetical protein